jgi:glutamate dehydrogenase (NADP+)
VIRRIYERREKEKNPWEKEYIQAVDELLFSLSPLFDQEPLYQNERILERIIEPERIVTCKTSWNDAK